MTRTVAVTMLALAAAYEPITAQNRVVFEEDFESGLDGWSFPLGRGHRIVSDGADRIVSEAAAGNRALRLQTVAEPVYALVDGSDTWADVRIEGRVLFPDDEHNYLGFIYRYRDDGRRIDFGSVYIKGNGSYAQANEHHDTNVGRTFYPELRSVLDRARAIEIGVWQSFALEVVGPEAHLYVGDMTTPAMTLPAAGSDRGLFGFEPRNPGAGVWLDDVRVTTIDDFSYGGPPIPDMRYDRDAFVTDWHVLGPVAEHSLDIETAEDFDPEMAVRTGAATVRWRRYAADHRGAVLTGRVTEFRGARRVAYFHATVQAREDGPAELWFSTVDDLAIWVDGTFIGYGGRQAYAWWDVGDHPDHAPLRSRITLRRGSNDILIRLLGGTYATGGFYLRIVERAPGTSRGVPDPAQ